MDPQNYTASDAVTLHIANMSDSKTADEIRTMLISEPSTADVFVSSHSGLASLTYPSDPQALAIKLSARTGHSVSVVPTDQSEIHLPVATTPQSRCIFLRIDGMHSEVDADQVSTVLSSVSGTADVVVSAEAALASLTFTGSHDTLVKAVAFHTGKLATLAHPRRVALRVPGLTPDTAQYIHRALATLPSATSVNIDYSARLVSLSFSGESSVLVNTIADATVDDIPILLVDGNPEEETEALDQSTSAKVSSVQQHPRLITLRVDGMTCMGCVGRVRQALEDVDTAQSVEVFLETGLATLTYAGDEEFLIKAVDEQAGKKASVVSLPPLQSAQSVTLHVDGMTCMGCVGRVREALESLDTATNVEVALDTGLATLVFAGDKDALVSVVQERAGKKAVFIDAESQKPSLFNLLDDTAALNRSDGLTPNDKAPSLDVSIERPINDGILLPVSEHSFAPSPGLETLSLESPLSSQSESTRNAFTVDDIATEEASLDSPAITRMRVGGMTCTTCVKSVENALLSVDGVTKASVQLLGRASVYHNPDLTDTHLLANAVEAAGFKADVLDTALPHARKSKSAEPTRFRIDFSTEIQAQNAQKILRFERGVLRALSNQKTLSVELAPGHLKAVVLRRLESDGRFGKMYVRQSYESEMASIKRGDNQGATDVIDDEARMWRKRFLLSLSFFIPILVISFLHRFGSLLSMRTTQWIHFFLATPVQFLCGAGFYRSSYYAIRKRRATMDVLVTLSTSIAYFSSVVVLLFDLGKVGSTSLGHSTMFRVSAMIITMVLVGKWLESSAKRRAAAGVAALSSLTPDVAVLYDLSEDVACHTKVPVDALAIGDVVRLIPGDRVPIDGEVIKGVSAVNESMLTGESKPVPKSAGDQLIGGTVNGSGSMLVRTTAVGEDAVLSQIVALVNDAQMARAPVEAYADAVSAVFVPAVVTISLFVFIAWFVSAQVGITPPEWYAEEGKFFFSLLFALETMVIACPCALGLATPTAVMVACDVGTGLGVLFRGGAAAVESGSGVKTVVFDKTGTLTKGQPAVVAVLVGEYGSKVVEQVGVLLSDLVLNVESESHHPLAAAICKHIKAETNWSSCNSMSYYKLSELHETPGCGIEATINKGEYNVCIGSPSFVFGKVDAHELFTEREIKSIERMGREEGLTVVIGAVNGKLGVVYGLEDTIRPEAVAVIDELHRMGVETAMVTGDASTSARVIGAHVGISPEHIHSEARPDNKLHKVREYEPACFVGDGVNDAPALTAATVGIAIGAGAPVAAESAPVVLVRSDLWGVVDALDLARATLRRVRLNFIWAIGYNLVSVPLAAGALYPFFQVRVPPMLASGAMALSSTCVVLSSLALHWYRPRGQEHLRNLSHSGSPQSVAGCDSSSQESDTIGAEKVKVPLLNEQGESIV